MDLNDYKVSEFITQYIEKGGTLVDVGANQGEYTSLFKRILDGSGKIYSIELHPETYKGLQIKFSEDNNVECLNLAISDTDGSCTYFSGRDSFTHNIIGHDMDYRANSPLGNIESKRLDTLLNDDKEINLIKIDVEGAELMVLRGLSGIIEKIKYILVECHLNNDWDNIKNILLKEYNLNCINVISGEIINENSERAYQCFCKKRYGN